MAVALNVPAGYFSDPNDLQGLTELLHHALLRGNPSYSTFQKFLSENNGDIKSMILADRAYFCADASTRVFEDVLAGFAGFFLEPSFSCNSSETDTNSYIDEKTSVLDNLQKYLTIPQVQTWFVFFLSRLIHDEFLYCCNMLSANNNNNNKAFKSQTSWGRLELKPIRSNQGSGT
ncbi:uncharacterized protein [Miscanthus floridulus]|uniref:uncharacterized protein isoform X1 n=1 Tax=Miscanthus floridulus TaxID=154761 RepID=UPI0034589144